MRPKPSAYLPFLTAALLLAAPHALGAQPTDPTPPTDEPPSPDNPPAEPPPAPPIPEPTMPDTPAPATPLHLQEPTPEPDLPHMSEGRMLVSLYNSGFSWGLSPGVAIVNDKVGFLLGARAGYGFDVGAVILVPGVRLVGYFTDPSVLVGMPVGRIVFPIDRFAPFLEAGAGGGYVSKPAKWGLSVLGGGGFMVHFNLNLALGLHASYETILGTDFRGFGVGPILAIGF